MIEDTSILPEQEEDDLEFLKWKEEFEKKTPEEQQKTLLEKAKEQVSDVDKQVLDDIVSLLNNNKDKHTDLLWLNDELEKKYPDINPLATLSYFLLLNTCGIVNLDDK
jgi:hypothetical protein